jgi:hypothetical protein
MRENDGGEPNQVTFQAYMEMSQWDPLYNYYVLIKMFKKEKKNKSWNQWNRIQKNHTKN